jgi:hypothetical protein
MGLTTATITGSSATPPVMPILREPQDSAFALLVGLPASSGKSEEARLVAGCRRRNFPACRGLNRVPLAS